MFKQTGRKEEEQERRRNVDTDVGVVMFGRIDRDLVSIGEDV